MPADDEINVTEVFIGCNGSGKSWSAMQRSVEIADEWDCPIVIHDTGTASIRKKDNPYHQSDWKLYTSIPKVTRYITDHDIYVINTANAEDSLIFADTIRRKKEVVVLIDEVTASIHIQPSNIGEPWRSRIAQRRAKKTALLFCMQSPTMASRFLTSTATALKCFRVVDADNLKALRGKGFSDEQLEAIPTLKRGEYVEVVQGFGTEE